MVDGAPFGSLEQTDPSPSVPMASQAHHKMDAPKLGIASRPVVPSEGREGVGGSVFNRLRFLRRGEEEKEEEQEEEKEKEQEEEGGANPTSKSFANPLFRL